MSATYDEPDDDVVAPESPGAASPPSEDAVPGSGTKRTRTRGGKP